MPRSDAITALGQFTHVIAGPDEPGYVPFVHPEAGGTGGTSEFGEIAVLRQGGHDDSPSRSSPW